MVTMKLVQRSPTFAWQGVLILLPVVVLTLLGCWSLRQDRLLAEQEARERAGRLAQEVADRALGPLLEADPTSPTNATTIAPGIDLYRPGFEITPQLSLVWPRPVESPPVPRSLDLAGLPDAARAAWDSAQRATFEGDGGAAPEAWTAFLAAEPPAPFAARARYELAQLAVRTGQTNEALSRFEELAMTDAAATLESGLPLAPLAAWKAVELRLAQTTAFAARAALLQLGCSNLVFQPTALTPDLLHRVEELGGSPRYDGLLFPPRENHARSLRVWQGFVSIMTWWQLWETTELSRDLFAAARGEWERRGLVLTDEAGAIALRASAALSPMWVELPAPEPLHVPSRGCAGTSWLVTRFPPASLRFHGWTECDVTNLLARIRRQLPDWPPYFDVTVTIADKTLPSPSPLPLLAARHARHSAPPDPEQPQLQASVYLADAAALYAQQRQRTWWFLAVVLAAAGTAGVGLLSAHRAFRRQLRLSELKSNFVSSVSHELRAPIASVRLLAESLERGKITDETKRREYFRLIGQECRRLSSLVESVLDFSRIDQGRKQYEFEPTDLVALVTQTAKLMEPYAAERQVSLQWHPPTMFNPQPTLDGKAIQQALVNLIDNAVKHAPAGTAVAVTLSTLPSPTPDRGSAPGSTVGLSRNLGPGSRPTDPPSRITLSVADQGPGIPPAEHARIFEPFYRRGSELRRETTGVGIGLAIVKHVVAAHGGSVRVESEPGQGSRFTLELPLCPGS